jgi:hypothetical protein
LGLSETFRSLKYPDYRDRHDRGLAILLRWCGCFGHSLLTGWFWLPDELATLTSQASCMGLRGVSADDPVLRLDIAEAIWNLVNWIPLFRGGFDFSGSSFDRIDGAGAGRQDRCTSACGLGCGPIRARCRKSYAICFVRLFGLGRVFLFFILL